MKTSHAYPPNYDAIKAALNPKPGAIFCYGDTVYIPQGGELHPAVHAHEQIHCDRQGDKVDEWWAEYLANPEFRLKEEVFAHVAEYVHTLQAGFSRPRRSQILKVMAERLSGPLYGNLVTAKRAKRMIKDGVKTVLGAA